ncbi:MAG TPA: tyrosine-type recombinase/integrase, partial [Polyangiaceae bacterium]
ESEQGIQSLYQQLARDEARNAAILNDVVHALKEGRSPLLLTERKDRHLRSERVLCKDDGRPATAKMLRTWVAVAQRRAGLPQTGALHILRHTFCSRLAIRGAPAKAIQELAGHADLGTTMRYMHLSPAAREGAIGLLNATSVAAAPKAAGA